MVLTTGQTYFYILCQAVVAVVICNMIHSLLRIRMLHRGTACKALDAIKKEVSDTRRLALLAYNKAAKKTEDK